MPDWRNALMGQNPHIRSIRYHTTAKVYVAYRLGKQIALVDEDEMKTCMGI